MEQKKERKLTLEQGLENVMNLPSERERIIGVIELIRGYANPFDKVEAPNQSEGYEECLHGLSNQRTKIKRLVDRYFNNRKHGFNRTRTNYIPNDRKPDYRSGRQ